MRTGTIRALAVVAVGLGIGAGVAGWRLQQEGSADALKLHARWVASDKAQTDLFAPEADLLPPTIADHRAADRLQWAGGWCIAFGCTLIGWSVGYTLGRGQRLAELEAAALANRREV